jgi:O-antigen/teichoic acid export membrane protein
MTAAAPRQALGKQVAKGAIWTISFRMADRLLGLVSTLILARLLVPADFGVVAMAMTLLAMIEVVTVGEFSSAIIQETNPTRDHYDTAWTMSAIFGLFATLLLLAGSIPTAAFFNEPRLVPVICALSVLPLLSGLFNMGCVDFRKYLNFQKDFVLQVGTKLCGLAAVLPLAFAFRSYWALVGGMIAGRFGGLVLSYALHPFRPRFSTRSARELFGFSAWLMVDNGLRFVRQRGTHLIIGRVLGSQALGLYTIAHEMSNLPTSELANPINRAVFPGYAKVRDDTAALQKGFLDVVGLIALVAVPAGLGMAAVAHLFVPAVLGPKWLDTVPLIPVLAVGGTVAVLAANNRSLYYAVGRPRIRALLTLLEIALFLPLVALLTHHYDLMGAAIAFLAMEIVVVPVNFVLAARLLKLEAARIFAVLWRPTVASLLMVAMVLAVFPPSVERIGTGANVQALALALLLGAFSYTALAWLGWILSGRPAGAERWLLDRGFDLWTRISRRMALTGHNSRTPSE